MSSGATKVPRPRDIEQFYRRTIEAIRTLSRQFDAIVQDPNSDFYGFNRPAFDDALRALREELDQQVVLALVAGTEAVLRLDYAERLKDSTKSPVGAPFVNLCRIYGEKVVLEDILDVWKRVMAAGNGEKVGAFKQLYNRRHWLAHGRYWLDKSGVQPRPRDAMIVIEDLFGAIKAFSSDFPRR